MAFFLIGRGPENNVRTLSDSLFATRQEAMAELSRLSADPAFDDWDSDVFVLDLDAGVPVLLVRPQEAGAEPPAVASTGDADAWVADLQQPAESPVESADTAPSATDEALPAEAQEPAEPAVAAEPEVAAGSEPPAETQGTDVAQTTSGTDETNLRDAILRTTQHMAAEGIAPPASAGFAAAEEPPPAAEESVIAEPEPELQESPEGPEPVDAAPVVTAEASAPEPVEPTPAVTEEAAVSEAMEAPLPPGPEDPEAPLATPGDESAAPAWPWDALGPEPVAAQAEAPQGAEADEASAEPQPEVEQSAAESESDFILDLDAIQPVTLESGDVVEQVDEPAVEVAAQDPEPPAPTPAPAPVAEVATSMAEYTCDDCVYVETCPNQGQRLPKDCGSFQWR